jgi:hypothetical protein
VGCKQPLFAGQTLDDYGPLQLLGLLDATDTLVCLCVYKRGAEEVAKRLREGDNSQQWQDANGPSEDGAGDVVGCPVF